jgi:hypothetical protein
MMTKHSDECYTPPWVFEALGVRFDLDVCGVHEGACVPADRVYTIADNGLVQPWWGHEFVWMNPPYSKPRPWVEKFMQHRNGIALLPLAKSAWFNMLFNDCKTACPLPPSVRFIKNGKPHSIFSGVILFGYGEQAVDAIARFREYKPIGMSCQA